MARVYGVPKAAPGLGGRRMGTGGGHAVGSNVRVVGVQEALIKLGLVNKVARIHLGMLSRVTAQSVEERAKQYVPVETGNLKSGISSHQVGPYTWQVIASSLEGADPAGVGKNSYEYAGFVEFGTSKMAPRRFMTQAWNETTPEVRVGLQWIARELERL